MTNQRFSIFRLYLNNVQCCRFSVDIVFVFMHAISVQCECCVLYHFQLSFHVSMEYNPFQCGHRLSFVYVVMPVLSEHLQLCVLVIPVSV